MGFLRRQRAKTKEPDTGEEGGKQPLPSSSVSPRLPRQGRKRKRRRRPEKRRDKRVAEARAFLLLHSPRSFENWGKGRQREREAPFPSHWQTEHHRSLLCLRRKVKGRLAFREKCISEIAPPAPKKIPRERTHVHRGKKKSNLFFSRLIRSLMPTGDKKMVPSPAPYSLSVRLGGPSFSSEAARGTDISVLCVRTESGRRGRPPGIICQYASGQKGDAEKEPSCERRRRKSNFSSSSSSAPPASSVSRLEK